MWDRLVNRAGQVGHALMKDQHRGIARNPALDSFLCLLRGISNNVNN